VHLLFVYQSFQSGCYAFLQTCLNYVSFFNLCHIIIVIIILSYYTVGYYLLIWIKLIIMNGLNILIFWLYNIIEVKPKFNKQIFTKQNCRINVDNNIPTFFDNRMVL
jgi:hypothetical protein